MSVSAAGQAEAWKKTVVIAQVNGRLASLPVRESDAVGGGQLLAALDPAEYELAVQEAEAVKKGRPESEGVATGGTATAEPGAPTADDAPKDD